MEQTVQDLRYAFRGLRRDPGFTLTVVGAAAIAIGASTAVFSAVDRVLFRPLPYRDEGRLVSAGIMAPLDTNEFMLADAYFDLRRNPGPFVAVTSFQAGGIACDLTEQSPLRMSCMRVEGSFLDTLGVRLAAGRPFSAEEDRPNGPRVAIISDALWRGRFAADPAAIGKALNIDGVPTRVAGVLPPDFVMPTLAHADILLPEALDEARERQGRALRVFARLKPGVTLPRARSQLEPYMARVMQTVPPQFRKEVTLRVRPLRDRQVGDARAASLGLLGAVLAVLLIACANIANLLLARAVGRDREIAVRAALGAFRLRLVRLALTESLLVAAAGGAAGCGLAFVLLRGFQAIAPEGLPRIQEATVDVRVLLFSATAAVLSGIVFGLLAALRRTQGAVMGGARTVGPARGWLRGALVTAQIAISIMLLTGAGLLLRSLDNLQRVPMGFESDRAITASFVLGRQRYSRDAEQLAFFGELERRLGTLPGVSAAAVSDSVPPFGATRGRLFSTIDVEGRPPVPQGSGGMVAWRYVTPGYFVAMGIPMRRGRPFTEWDRGPSVYSVVLSDTLARMMFPGEDPLGKHIQRGPRGQWFTVVGVAADARHTEAAEQTIGPEYYFVRKAVPDAVWANQEPPLGWRGGVAVVRTAVDPRLAASSLRGLFASLDPTLPVEIATMRERLALSTGRPRFQATLPGGFRRHRIAAGGHRAERGDVLPGGAEAPRDRRADGAGGYAGQHREVDAGLRGAMHVGGRCNRWRRSVAGHSVAAGAVVPGAGGRFAAARGRGGAAGSGGVHGGGGTGAARGAGGPGHYLAGGLTAAVRLIETPAGPAVSTCRITLFWVFSALDSAISGTPG
jgi:predicted permease